MEKPAFISSAQEVNHGLDFNYLRAEGVQAIQELTGAFWTDFNEHDPGVTILEQLCYAITDLCYRTEFDVQDHLYNQSDDDTFLKAHEILPCNALTVNDYRKLIFDSVFELKNVWVEAIQKDGTSFSGLYKILIDIDENLKGKENKNAVVEKTRKVFSDNRNICEDIEEIKVLSHLEVSVFADVEVDGIKDTESILARIYYKVEEYLSPEIRFYSLQELLQEGYELNEVFNGPLLKHGFIKTSELQPKPNKILISEIIKIIMQVPGVVSVKNLYLMVGENKYENQVDIGEAELPKLVKVLDDTKGTPRIQFFRGTVNYTTIDYKVVKRQLNELQSANKRVYRLSEETIKIPLGKKLNVENYYSIQNQFPLIYGIGPYGIPNSSDTARKAQAKQLKGYLLIFEQILANYLSQLSNVKTLFSLKEDVKQTYFYQSLDTVPDVKPLLKERKFEFIDETDPNANVSLSYKSGLPELVKLKDNYADRRNRFLDYLLAIHGESYTQYSLSQFNYYFNDEEFERHLIQNKTRLLKSLSTINKNRARAFNYLEPSLDTENITGMEAKISILLGLGVQHSEQVTNYKAHSLLNHYAGYGLKLVEDASEDELLDDWERQGELPEGISPEYIDENFDFIDTDEVNVEAFSDEGKNEILSKTLPFRSAVITTGFLKEAISEINFRAGKLLVEDGKYVLEPTQKKEEETVIKKKSKNSWAWEWEEEGKTTEFADQENKEVDNVEMEESKDEQEGALLENEEVSKEVEERWVLVFREEAKRTWKFIGEFNSEDEVNIAVLELLRVVKELNIQSEGLHIIEHILLRPDLKDQNHGILIYDENRKAILKSAEQYSFEEREIAIKEIKAHLYEFSNYSVEATRDKDFEIHFKTPDDKYHFVSLEADPSVEATHEKMEKLFQFITDLHVIRSFDEKIGLYVLNSYSRNVIPEDFFSYRVSVLLPDWTARFGNKEFRSIIEDTIHEQKPANVALQCYWLTPANLMEFENVYYEWMEEKRNPEIDKEKMDKLNNQISELLSRFKESCEL